MKRPDGITLISIYHFLIAGLSIVGIIMAMVIPLFVGLSAMAYDARSTGVAVGSTLLIVLLFAGILGVIAAANLIVGIGLWNFQPWSRIAAIVLAAFRLFNFPVGTAIGGLTIWYLLRQDIEPLFRG